MHGFFRIVGRVLGTLRAEYRQIANRYWGKVERFDGDAREICRQVVDRLWYKNFFRTSLGHFDFFWMRDFGTACAPLVHIGHRDKVHHTLRWALRHYRKSGIVTTCIDSIGNTFNAPDLKAIDTLPWLLHCLWVSHYQLSATERTFLNKMLRKYTKQFLVKETGLIKPGIRYAEMRDAVIYDRSAYAIALIARMARCAEKMGLDGFLYSPSIYRQELMDNYWNGRFFKADFNTNAFSAECALFPFYLGIVDDKAMATKTFDYIDQKQLNKPYPLIYTDNTKAFKHRFWMTAPFMPEYEDGTVWSWHGVFYLYLLRRYGDRRYAKQHASFTRMIERHGTWPEMLNADGSWYLSPIYKGDPGMIWAALYIDL